MQILLINDNSSVSKLINLTAKKYNYDIKEISDIAELEEEHKNIIFIDDAMSENLDIDIIKEKTGCSELVYIVSKGSQIPNGYKYTLKKPFLPSDFQNIIETITDINKTIDEDISVDEITKDIEDVVGENEELILDELKTDEAKDESFKDNISDSVEKLDNEQNDIEINNKDNTNEDEELSLEEDLFLDDEDSIEETNEDEVITDDMSKDDGENTAILDQEDIKEVKELLDENEEESIDDELQMAEDDIDTDILHSTQDSFDISDLQDDGNDMDDFLLEEDEDNEKLDELSIDDIQEGTISDINEENINEEIFGKNKDIKLDNDMSLHNEDEVIEDKEDTKKNGLNNAVSNKSAEELDLIDEQSLKELFGQSDSKEEVQDMSNNEEDMEVESFEEIKSQKKKKNKKKKLKKDKLNLLQEEITSKLLDIDTLREVLDGMEIHIKFYNKK